MPNSLEYHENKAAVILKVCGVQKVARSGNEGSEKFWKCPAESCRETFKNLVDVKNHFIQTHNNRPFMCDVAQCTWSFPTQSKLERHKNAHTNEKFYKCKVDGCIKAFKTKSNLRHHEKTLHTDEASFSCAVDGCGSSFRLQQQLELHSKNHVELKPTHRCPEPDCGKDFITKSALCSHVRRHRHSKEELKCFICDKIFEAPCRLKSHMQSHNGNKPFACTEPDCEWTFPTPSKLARHMDKHLQRRRYACTFPKCHKAFLRAQHLHDHQLTHTRVPSYPCPVEACSSDFPARRLVRLHVRQVHSDIFLTLKKRTSSATAARTSLTYCDIVLEKRQKEITARSGHTQADHCGTTPPTQAAQEESFNIQEDLLNQDYLQALLDASTPFSALEPSTINLRDLE